MKTITGSKLYDYIQCPHKVWRDVYGPKEEKITESYNRIINLKKLFKIIPSEKITDEDKDEIKNKTDDFDDK